jgi:hypothetical protein
MADSDAVRQQRRRRHRSGDHSMCRRGCQDARTSPRIAEVPSGSAENFDPAGALRALARRLEAAYGADPSNGLLAKELRQTLVLLLPTRDAAVDAEWKQIMGELSRPVPRSETPDWFDDGG